MGRIFYGPMPSRFYINVYNNTFIQLNLVIAIGMLLRDFQPA